MEKRTIFEICVGLILVCTIAVLITINVMANNKVASTGTKGGSVSVAATVPPSDVYVEMMTEYIQAYEDGTITTAEFEEDHTIVVNALNRVYGK
jgi:hypothetical protein